jgi:8-oxo-dGTP pyrophosphatase MutT (NUDIX family)
MLLQVGVKALLRNESGAFLLLKRSLVKYKNILGAWEIPGGRIDPGTPLLANLQREVYEETKLVMVGEPKLIAAQDILRNDDRHIVRLTYTGMVTGEPELDGIEHDEYRWVTFDELQSEKDLDYYLLQLITSGVFAELF